MVKKTPSRRASDDEADTPHSSSHKLNTHKKNKTPENRTPSRRNSEDDEVEEKEHHKQTVNKKKTPSRKNSDDELDSHSDKDNHKNTVSKKKTPSRRNSEDELETKDTKHKRKPSSRRNSEEEEIDVHNNHRSKRGRNKTSEGEDDEEEDEIHRSKHHHSKRNLSHHSTPQLQHIHAHHSTSVGNFHEEEHVHHDHQHLRGLSFHSLKESVLNLFHHGDHHHKSSTSRSSHSTPTHSSPNESDRDDDKKDNQNSKRDHHKESDLKKDVKILSENVKDNVEKESVHKSDSAKKVAHITFKENAVPPPHPLITDSLPQKSNGNNGSNGSNGSSGNSRNNSDDEKKNEESDDDNDNNNNNDNEFNEDDDDFVCSHPQCPVNNDVIENQCFIDVEKPNNNNVNHDSPLILNCPSNGLDAFERVKLIGRGDVGKVYLVRHKLTGMPYAMKVMSKEEMVRRRKIHRALTEREILISSNFPLLVTMHYSFQNDRNLYFVMDYCAGGEFFRALQRQPGKVLPESSAKFYAAEVLMALEYLHMKGIVYRDLKPENILLTESGHVMLTDFNLSKQSSQPVIPKVIKGVFDSADRAKVELKPHLFATSLVGTEEYLAPEVVRGCSHNSALDWWTFGVLLYEMLFGVTPFKGRNRDETFNLIKKSGVKFPKTPAVSVECKNLIQKLLTVNPQKRLGSEHGASDIKAHPFFRDIKWPLILNEVPPIRPQLSDPFDTSNFRDIEEEIEDCSSVDLRTKLADPFKDLKDMERPGHDRLSSVSLSSDRKPKSP